MLEIIELVSTERLHLRDFHLLTCLHLRAFTNALNIVQKFATTARNIKWIINNLHFQANIYDFIFYKYVDIYTYICKYEKYENNYDNID